MRGRPFSDILDDALGAAAADHAAVETARPVFQAPHPFLFFKIAQPAGMSQRPSAVAAGLPVARFDAPSKAAAARLLTADERQALELLNALGATLDAAFTAGELRRQYRTLALRLHPDRHPGADAEQRVRLSRAFSAATDSYRLLSAIATAH